MTKIEFILWSLFCLWVGRLPYLSDRAKLTAISKYKDSL